MHARIKTWTFPTKREHTRRAFITRKEETTEEGREEGEAEGAGVEEPPQGVVEAAVDGSGDEWGEETECDGEDEDGGFPGCAGVSPVFASADNGIDASDPETAGGDAFDLSEVGLETAWFVRIEDTGTNEYLSNVGGFDLDVREVAMNKELSDMFHLTGVSNAAHVFIKARFAYMS